MRTLKFLVPTALLGPLIGAFAYILSDNAKDLVPSGTGVSVQNLSLAKHLFLHLGTLLFLYPTAVLLCSPFTLSVGLTLAMTSKSKKMPLNLTPDKLALVVGSVASLPLAIYFSTSHLPRTLHFGIVNLGWILGWLLGYLAIGGVSTVVSGRLATAWDRHSPSTRNTHKARQATKSSESERKYTRVFLVTTVFLGPLIGCFELIAFLYGRSGAHLLPEVNVLSRFAGSLVALTTAYPIALLLLSPFTVTAGLLLARASRSRLSRFSTLPDIVALIVGLLASTPLSLLLALNRDVGGTLHRDTGFLLFSLLAGSVATLVCNRVAIARIRHYVRKSSSS